MASEPNSSIALTPTVWIALILSLAGAFAIHHGPFQDSRPPDPVASIYRHLPSEDQDVEARLWEDPLAAIAIARAADDQVANVPPQHTIERMHDTVTEYLAKSGRVLVLVALVSGAPYAEDVETRRRMRFAVLAGLYRSDYIPVNNEHIGYVTLAEFYPTPAQSHDVAAYEWFQPNHSSSARAEPEVLLLWLDQDGFRDAPLARISRIVNSLLSWDACTPTFDPEVVTTILGPADSDGLRAMSVELQKETDNSCGTPGRELRKVTIYSPRATAPDATVLGEGLSSGQTQTLSQLFNDWSDGRVQLYRSVASDDLLAQRLQTELSYRGVKDASEIALVEERDTLYGRQMGEYFGGCEGSSNLVQPGTEQAVSQNHPLCFTYLRGLDGRAPPAPATDASSARATSNTTPVPSQSIPPPVSEAATGQGQLDYLRRLATALAFESAGANKRHTIKAVGILGSDVYDKMLILQALRGSFPRATFFTTDLDARLFEQDSLPWTRQLIVASSLGLALRPCLQQGIPPFRDTYQSAAYFSTVLALHKSLLPVPMSSDVSTGKQARSPVTASAPGVQCSAEKSGAPTRHIVSRDLQSKVPRGLQWTLSPRIFEIGRTQPFDLTEDPDAKAACDFDGVCESIARAEPTALVGKSSGRYSFYFGLVLSSIAIAIGWAAMGTRWLMDTIIGREGDSSHSRIKRRALALTTLLALVVLGMLIWPLMVLALTDPDTGVPATVFGGESLAAANLVEMLSILAVVTLVIRGQRKLNENADDMQVEFGFMTSRAELVAARASEVRSWTASARTMELYLYSNSKKSDGQSALKGLAGISEIEVLIARYLYRGTAKARLVRVALATGIATAVLVVLELTLDRSLVGGAELFTTGSFESGLTNTISIVSLVSMLFLILWVGDATLLSRSFLLELLQRKPEWPQGIVQSAQLKLALPVDEVTLWLDLRLICMRTTWVAALIWYPSLIILAMTLAALTVEFGQFGFANNPLALIIGATLVVIAAVKLRQVAESWRDAVREHIMDARLRELGQGAPFGTAATQLDRLLERVNDLSGGAFAPFTGQPFVRAVVLPLATYGATAVLPYLHVGT